MATVNFSVPDEVKDAFNEAFAGENKSAVIAGLMRQAVEARRLQQQRARAIDALLALRSKAKPVDSETIHRARVQDRP